MRFMRQRFLPVLLLCAVVCPCGNASAQDSKLPAPPAIDVKYNLRYKFKPGETVRAEIVHRATVESTIQNNTQKAETRTKSVKLWQIETAEEDGTIKLVHSVESIDMWQRMQGRQEVHYNSLTDPEAPAGYEDVAKAVGVPLTQVIIDVRGKVLQRKELHAQSNANPMPLLLPLPTEPVAIGATWNHPVEIEVRLTSGNVKKLQTRLKFNLEKVSHGVATIHVEGQTLTPVNDPAIEAQLVQRLPAGTVRFDLDAGRVIAQEMDVDRRVIGFNGPSSSMHYLSNFVETIKPAATETARKPKKVESAPVTAAEPAVKNSEPAAEIAPATKPSEPVAKAAAPVANVAKPVTTAAAPVAKPAAPVSKPAPVKKSLRR
jgi:hypothetical protein